MNNEKKLVLIVRQFVEKAIVPAIKTNDMAMAEWHYFSSLLAQETLDLGKLQIYVDALSSSKAYNDDFTLKKEEDKSKHTGPFAKKKEDSTDGIQTYTFNPSRTFGGERNRPALYPLKPSHEFSVPSADKDPFSKK